MIKKYIEIYLIKKYYDSEMILVMANRPAWTIDDNKIITESFEFKWNGGFAVSQKKKNVIALHNSIKETTGKLSLEVSTKGDEELGNKFSAFNLKLDDIYLENIFQSAKVYEKGGPFWDLLEVEPKEAKRDKRHKESGRLLSFEYKGEKWDLKPKTAFYDYIYYLAVKQNIKSKLITYDDISNLAKYSYFTDIEFNPSKSINSQGRAIVIIKYLFRDDVYNKYKFKLNKEEWLEFHKEFVKI